MKKLSAKLDTLSNKLNNLSIKEKTITVSNTIEKADTITGPRIGTTLHNNNSNAIQTNITERKIGSFMTRDQANEANIEELRKEIINAEKAGIADNQIVELKCVLGTKLEASAEEILFLAQWHENNGGSFYARTHYDRILSLSEVSNNEKIIILKNIIKQAWDENEPAQIINYCQLLLKIVPKGSRDEADVFKILSDTYTDEGIPETTIYYSRLVLNHPKTNRQEKEKAFAAIADCITDLKDPDALLRTFVSFLSDNQSRLSEICLSQILSLNRLYLKDKITALKELYNVHIKNHDFIKAINTCNQLILLTDNHEDKINALKNIAHCYNNLGQQNTMLKYYESILVLDQLNSEMIINILFDLKDLCIQNENIEKAIEYCNKALVIEGIDPSDEIYALKCLSDLYSDKSKKMECLNAIFMIPEATMDDRFFAQDALADLY